MQHIFEAPFPRRALLRLIGTSFLTLLGGHWLLPGRAAASAAPPPAFLRQLATADPASSRTLMWQTDNAAGRVRVQLKGGPLTAAREYTPAVTRQPGSEHPFLYSVTITGLVPGQRYAFRIVTEDGAGAWQPLLTPAAGKKLSALLFSDAQSTDGYRDFSRLLAGAAARHPEAALLLLPGDLVDNGAEAYYWDQLFHALSKSAPQLTLVPVLGNHECYSSTWEYCLPESYLAYFSLPDNSSPRLKGHYYSCEAGEVHFSILDTQWEEEGSFFPELWEEQAAWLRREAKANTKKWHIVLMHRDIINYEALLWQAQEQDADISPTGKFFMPLFDELGIDAVLTGHEHIYRRRPRLKGFHRNQGGTLCICCGVTGNDRGYRMPRARFDDVLEPDADKQIYLLLEADSSTLSFRAFLANGKETDSVTLRK